MAVEEKNLKAWPICETHTIASSASKRKFQTKNKTHKTSYMKSPSITSHVDVNIK